MFQDEDSEIFNLNKTISNKKNFIDKVMEWLHPKSKAATPFDKYSLNGEEISINE